MSAAKDFAHCAPDPQEPPSIQAPVRRTPTTIAALLQQGRWFSGALIKAAFRSTLIAAAAISSSCMPYHESPMHCEVLFVGNSLTYVGNLPAVFDALASGGPAKTESDMIVAPGATLTDRVRDDSVAKALVAKRYQVVILQERGGDFTCGFGAASCSNAEESLKALARLVRAHGARPILLGTYEGSDAASAELVGAESRAAERAGADYVSVGAVLARSRSQYPEMSWFAKDGMHPGPDLTLLEAILLFREIHGTNPPLAAITVKAPIYSLQGPTSTAVRSASAPADVPGARDGISYDLEHITTLLKTTKT